MADHDRRVEWVPATNPDPPGTVFPNERNPVWLREFVSKVMSAPKGTRLAVARSLGITDAPSTTRAELLKAMAQKLAPDLAGLSIAEAQARVDSEPGLRLSLVSETERRR